MPVRKEIKPEAQKEGVPKVQIVTENELINWRLEQIDKKLEELLNLAKEE